MKEANLIDLGFERIDVSAEESGDNAFYYYTKDFGENNVLSLISTANDQLVDGEWWVEVFEDDSIKIDDEDDLEDFIEIVTRIVNKQIERVRGVSLSTEGDPRE